MRAAAGEAAVTAAQPMTTPSYYCDPPGASSCSSHWQPSPDFEANIVVVLIVLLCALICIFALNGAIRCFLHTPPPPHQHIRTGSAEDPEKQSINSVLMMKLEPPIVYSASAGLKLAGGGEECAICLADFMEGEGLRVLGSCRHGFHSHCIERWLLTQSSCPTCRQTCSLYSPSSSAPELVGRSDEDCSQDGGRGTVFPESSSRRLE